MASRPTSRPTLFSSRVYVSTHGFPTLPLYMYTLALGTLGKWAEQLLVVTAENDKGQNYNIIKLINDDNPTRI